MTWRGSKAGGDVQGLASGELITAARALAADAVCAEVVSGWQAAGIDAVLLKGPTTAEWLYPHAVRGYVDTDLLVDPARVLDAADVLRALGFDYVKVHVAEHSHPWVRLSDGAEVDLHVTLWGPHLTPFQVWEAIQEWLEVRHIGTVAVRTPNLAARALLVVLHAAQHRDDGKTRPRADLRRALEAAPASIWPQVDELAYKLRVLTETGEGLMLEPEGRQLVERLPLIHAAAFGRSEHAPLAIGFQRLSSTPGPLRKLGVILRALTRPRDELGLGLLPDSDGRRSLAAYVRGPIWVLSGLPRTMVALWRARRNGPAGH
jgi:hypothetical protein